jgi:hypothetical protein
MAGMKKVVLGFGLVLGVYLIGRAIAEFFVIDFSDPASYRADWGGPRLAGVLAVHCGFRLVALMLIGWGTGRAIRRRSDRRHRPEIG